MARAAAGTLRFLRVACGRTYGSAGAAGSDPFGPPPLAPQRRVVVTGLGLVTPLAEGVDATWQRLIRGDCAIRQLRPADIATNGGLALAERTLSQLPSRIAARVPDELLDAQQDGRMAAFVVYALKAAAEALADAGWAPEDKHERQRTGVAIGSGIGCIADIMEAGQLVATERLRRLSPFFIPKILINMAAGHVSIKHGFAGPNHAAVTACASGAHSIGDAARFIRYGDADVMVAGSSEACVDSIALAGFGRMKALTTSYNDKPAEASRPFDKDRSGFVIGEGAGVLVLEELEHARERGAKMYAEVRGYGTSGDANHITQPLAEGTGALLAMQRALQQASGLPNAVMYRCHCSPALIKLDACLQAGLNPRDVTYINAHATSTPLGDAAEATAISKVFESRLTSCNVAVSSTKGAIGHLLGAAGAVESIFTVLAIAKGVVPPTINLHTLDVGVNGNFVPRVALRQETRAALNNSFGFGGTNACIAFTSPPD
eukprot:jgi/Chlat1/4817/Chrsp31S04865